MVTTGNQGSWLDGYTRNDVALTDSVKGPVCAGGAVIVSVTVNVCMVWPTLVPCTVKVVVPVAAAPPTLTVMVLDEVVASTWGGLNPTVTQVGSDVASNDTEPVKPPDRVIVTERLLFALRAMVSEVPEAAMTNPPPVGGGGGEVVPPSPPPPPHPRAKAARNARVRLEETGLFLRLGTMRRLLQV